MVLQEFPAYRVWYGSAVREWNGGAGLADGYRRRIDWLEATFYGFLVQSGATIYLDLPYDVRRRQIGKELIIANNFGGGTAGDAVIVDSVGGIVATLNRGVSAKVYLVDTTNPEGIWDVDLRFTTSRRVLQ